MALPTIPMNTEHALYISKPHPFSWNQEYRIYSDRIELRAKILFCTLRVPLEDVVEITVRPKPAAVDFVRHPVETLWSYNNDRAAFYRHVYLRRKGWPPRIRFVPDDPDGLVAVCRKLLAYPSA